MTTPDPRLEALNEAWKEFLATALRRNIVVAVNDHRALVEAAVLRYHPPLDVERLVREVAGGLNAKKRHQYTSWYDVTTVLDVVRHAAARLENQ